MLLECHTFDFNRRNRYKNTWSQNSVRFSYRSYLTQYIHRAVAPTQKHEISGVIRSCQICQQYLWESGALLNPPTPILCLFQKALHFISLHCSANSAWWKHCAPLSKAHFEKTLEHDVYDLVLLIHIIEFNQVLQCIHLVFAFYFKQFLICSLVKGSEHLKILPWSLPSNSPCL